MEKVGLDNEIVEFLGTSIAQKRAYVEWLLRTRLPEVYNRTYTNPTGEIHHTLTHGSVGTANIAANSIRRVIESIDAETKSLHDLCDMRDRLLTETDQETVFVNEQEWFMKNNRSWIPADNGKQKSDQKF